jgi:cysteine desulfurase family protein (TIGR01976 family)
LDVPALRDRFPALARTGPDGRPFVWADAPGGSQVPQEVIDAVAGRMRDGASNTHGAFPVSAAIDEVIGRAHEAGAAFLGCRPDEVVFGQNATSVLLHLSRSFARTLGPGDEVVVTRLDHDANIRPWVLAARDAGATVRWVDVREDDCTLDLDTLDTALSPRTRLVACTLASNAVGTIPPVAAVVERARSAGALVALDGVHLAQHRLPDLAGWDADIVATSPYKFFGPHQGMVGVRRELLDTWEPYKLRPVEDVNPDRWETGTLSHEAMAGTIAAIDYLAGLGEGPSLRTRLADGFARIGAHEAGLATRFLEGIAALDGVRLIGIADPGRAGERTPTFAVRVDGRSPVETSADLAAQGIWTWDGHYYAIEIFERLGLLASGGAVRIGFCHYHLPEDVDRVLEALRGPGGVDR